MGDSSLTAIVKAFQAGSCEAFAKLVGRYQNLATSIAFANTGDLQRSEDIAQQAFLVAWQKQNELADPDRFAGWIRGIVTNIARNERRIKENRVQKAAVELSEQHAPATDATPQAKASRAEQSELLWSRLNQIPLEYREPLVLFYREDLSVAAVAEQMELSQDVVKQRLSRGRKMLKKEIETMVEEFLVDSKPAGQFTAGVIAVLPSVSATAKAAAIKAATAKVGQVTLGKAALGKTAASTLTSGALLGLAGGILGSLGGLFGAWRAIKHGIKEATSEEEVQEHKNLFRYLTFLMVALLLGILLAGQVPAPWRAAPVVLLQGIFAGSLAMLMLRFNRRQTELHCTHGLPNSYVQTVKEDADFASSDQSTFWGKTLGIAGGIIGACAWLIVLSIQQQAWWLAAVVVLLSGLLLVRSVNVCASHADMPNSKNLRHIQVLCRDLGILQVAVLMLMWATGGFADTQGMIEGYPIWVMLAFIVVLCSGLYFGMGYAAENARRREQGNA